MKKNKIVFNLSASEQIVIELETPLSEVHCCYYDAIIAFMYDGKRYVLSDNIIDSLRINIEYLSNMLSEALNNKLTLHKCLSCDENDVRDIGYMYNECRQEKPDVVYEIAEGHKFKSWIGYKYLLWGSELIAWIYNDNDGNIIFKLTPNFPGKPTTVDPEEPLTPEEITNSRRYDEWIRGYKPFFMAKIPREVALEWLSQANKILETIEKNVQRMEAEHEASGKHNH